MDIFSYTYSLNFSSHSFALKDPYPEAKKMICFLFPCIYNLFTHLLLGITLLFFLYSGGVPLPWCFCGYSSPHEKAFVFYFQQQMRNLCSFFSFCLPTPHLFFIIYYSTHLVPNINPRYFVLLTFGICHSFTVTIGVLFRSNFASSIIVPLSDNQLALFPHFSSNSLQIIFSVCRRQFVLY